MEPAREQEKRDQTLSTMQQLYARYESMSASEILQELSAIHLTRGVPGMLTEGGLTFLYKITSHIADSELSSQDAMPLANMILWPEIQQNLDRSSGLNILEALGKIPTNTILPHLHQHREFLDKLIRKEGPGSHLYADATQEMKLVNELIKECESSNKQPSSNGSS